MKAFAMAGHRIATTVAVLLIAMIILPLQASAATRMQLDHSGR